MTPREIKIAMAIKRQKKSGLLKKNGGVDVDLKHIGDTRKWKIHSGHKDKGGIHKQNDSRVKNVNATKTTKLFTGALHG